MKKHHLNKNQAPIPETPEARKKYWEDQLTQMPGLEIFLQDYQSASVAAFKEHVIRNKEYWYSRHAHFAAEREEIALRWQNMAHEQLKIIQQKKLFDAQCLWRAEKIKISQVNTAYEFEGWGQDVLNCPFIEPVSMKDVDLYISFLESGNRDLYEDDPWALDEWQDYDSLREAYEEEGEDEFPEWYAYHNNMTGRHSLMDLPDIRGKKESFYRQLWYNRKQAETAANNTTEQKPYLSYHSDEFMQWYLETFEDRETRGFYENYKWGTRLEDQLERLTQTVSFLLSVEEPVPAQSGPNCLLALEGAAEKYKTKKTIEALPLAWESYMLNIQAGISFRNEKNHKLDLAHHFATDILNGRELNGEPRDFNF